MPGTLDPYRPQFETAAEEVHQLYLLRYVWKNLLEMLRSNPDIRHTGLMNNWLVTCYSRTLAVGIRRQTDDTGSRATIASLLRRLQAQAGSLTYGGCGFDQLDEPIRPDPWLKYASTLTGHVDPQRVAAVRQILTDSAAASRHWVNKRIAHLDPNYQDVDVTFDDLEAALAGLKQGLEFLYGLFHPGAILAFVTPEPTLAWLRMFEEPWYKPALMTPLGAHDLG